MAVKQLKSGDISVYTANIVDADSLKEQLEVWVKALGSKTRILNPTYGVLAYAVRTDKKNRGYWQAGSIDWKGPDRKCGPSSGREDHICGKVYNERSEENGILPSR